MIDNRDMMQLGFQQGYPGNMSYGNFGYQTPPGMMPNNFILPNMIGNNNPLIDLNARISNLENRVNTLEAKLNGKTNLNNIQYQDDNSLYML